MSRKNRRRNAASQLKIFSPQPYAPPGQGAQTQPCFSEMDSARELLCGARVVLIGGDPRPKLHDNIVTSLELSELDWIATRKHSPLHHMESQIARGDTRLVLLAIRWSSHSYGQLESLCKSLHIPFVRLPGGLNPAQIAHAVLMQCSKRLQAA